MGVKVAFLGDEPEQKSGAASSTVIIPQSAVRDENGSKTVFLVKEDHVERRAVKLGAAQGSDQQVMAGLVAGDTVVVKGPADLHDGEAIEIKK